MKTINIKKTSPKVVRFFKNLFKNSYKKLMSFDFVDGQGRAESIARRIFLLITLILALWVLVDMLVDNGVLKTNSQARVDTALNIPSPSPVIALEQTEVQNRTTDTTLEKETVPESLGASEDKVVKYIKSYGGRFSSEYVATLRKYCDEDTLKLVVAISVAETGMGRARLDKQSNWYGYFYGGDRKYDPDIETMSKVICNGISKYYYDVDTNVVRAKRYTGGDNTTTWMANVRAALANME